MGDEIYEPSTRDQWLSKLPPARQRLAKLLSTEVDKLGEVQEEAEAWLFEQAHQHTEVRRLMTLPGIGPVRAAYIVAIPRAGRDHSKRSPRPPSSDGTAC